MFSRRSRILIADNTPLSVLSLLGEEALDWLFVPGAEVWITDMVEEEAIRDPGPDRDQRHSQRAELIRWFDRNAGRIHIQPTTEGEQYANAMELWRLAGNPPGMKPAWADRGDRSIFQAMRAIEAVLADGEAVVAIMDDRAARATLSTMNLDLDMMSTESFVVWMNEGFRIRGADTAWQTIAAVMGDGIPRLRPEDDEPISTFKA